MSADVMDRLNDLTSKMGQMNEQIANMVADRGGSVSGERSGEGTFSFFEGEGGGGPISLTKSELSQLKRRQRVRRGLPNQYKPMFKSMSHFVQTGFQDKAIFDNLYGQAISQLEKANAMNGVDSDSLGMLVLPEFAPDIADILYDETDLLGMTDQYTVSGREMRFPRLNQSSRAKGVRNGGLQGAWLEEGDLPVASRASLQATHLRLKKLAVVVYLSEDLLDDNSYALEQWITSAVRREIQFMISDAIMNGNGGGMPLGIINAPVTVTVPKVSGQSNGTLLAQNILDMYSRRRSSAPINEYCWWINQNVEPQLNGMVLPAGGIQNVVYLPPGGLSASPYASLMGCPVRSTEFNPILGQKGDIIFARMKGYVTINKGGINEVQSSHVEFLREQLAIKFTFRIDGRPMYDAPTTPYKSNGADQQSDFICLQAR